MSDNASTDGTWRSSRRTPHVMRGSEPSGRIGTSGQRPTSTSSLVNQAAHSSCGRRSEDHFLPGYVSCCVGALTTNPAAVLACSSVRFIDEQGQAIDLDYHRFDNPRLAGHSRRARLRSLVRRSGWYAIYGLVRSEVLARTRLAQNIYGSDVVLLAELALLGEFAKVPDVLQLYRRYSDRTEADRVERQGLPDSDRRSRLFPYTSLSRSLDATVRDAGLGRLEAAAIRLEIVCGCYLVPTAISARTWEEARQRELEHI